jgi:hypothetical protein
MFTFLAHSLKHDSNASLPKWIKAFRERVNKKIERKHDRSESFEQIIGLSEYE